MEAKIVNLYFKSITIVDLSNSEAKRIQFAKGKNLLTSSGNHYGKSVIMKSLYYTLGAEVFFPEPIKALRFLSILDFKLGDTDYSVGRLKNNFVLYKGEEFVGRYTSVGSFGEFLSSLLKLEISLVGKDPEGTIVPSPPAFLFLPYYIDQENGWAINSYSFANMTQFDLPQRKDSYYFHLGAFDNSYVENNKKLRTNQRRIDALEKEQNNFEAVINTLNSGLNEVQMVFDVEGIENTIAKRKKKIIEILENIAKARNDLIETEDSYQHLLNEKNVISKYLKNKKNINSSEEKVLVECPECGSIFEQSLYQRVKKEYLLESLHEDYSKLIEELQKKESRISKLKTKYEKYQSDLIDCEKTLGKDQSVYDTYLRMKTTKNIVEEYNIKIGENTRLIHELTETSKAIKETLTAYSNQKKEVSNAYSNNFKTYMQVLDIPSDQVSGDYEPGSQLTASGAYGPRCKIAQVLTFIEIQKKFAENLVSLPVVIDSPNALEQDKNNLESVFNTLFTWDKTENQIIVASIEGKDIAENLEDVSVIELDSSINHVMTKDEFEKHQKNIETILSRF